MVDFGTVEFADALLAALGMKSITASSQADEENLGATQIYGRSYLSGRNRAALLKALGHEPRPATIEDLATACDALASAGDEDVEAIREVVKSAARARPDFRLDELVS